MRIVHVIDAFQPVLGYQETFLSKAQLERGHEVHVVTSDRHAKLCGITDEILKESAIRVGRFTEEGVPVIRLRSRFDLLNSTWLDDLERVVVDLNPDVIHVHGVVSLTAARIALMKRHLKRTTLVFDDHMTYNAMRGEWVSLFYKIFRFMMSWLILERADYLVAVTEETRTFMKNMYGFPYERIRVIPLGCDSSRFLRDESSRTRLRKEFGIPDDAIVYCYVGKIVAPKGVDILIKAALELINAGHNVRILLVGGRDPGYFGELERMIRDSGHERHFIVVPFVPNNELYKYYSMADVGVWPRQCSISMIEAMSCGVPVIISSTSGTPERVLQKDTGLIFKEGNVEDLKQKMMAFMDRKRMDGMSKRAREFGSCCDWLSISSMFEELYAKERTAK